MAFGIKKLLKKITPGESQAEPAESETTPKTKKDSSTKSSSVQATQSNTKTGAKAAASSKTGVDSQTDEQTEVQPKTTSKSTKTKSSKKEEKAMTTENVTPSAGTIRHEFVEVAADLLAKPSALCDLVEAQGGKAVLVFCNNPSDTDFVEVILKKRGISAVKLIGFVAPEKLEKTQERVKSADLAAVVITDVAARGLDFSLFPVVVNYSLPADPEAYNIRSAVGHPGDRVAVSIVSPLDFANFHQLKTSTTFEFIKREPPSKEDLAKAKLCKVKTSAQAKCAALDPALSELAKQIGKDSDSIGIIAYLLQNLFEVVPQLQSQVDKLSWERENLDHGEDDIGQDGQGQPRGGRGDRDSRGGRYDSRGGRDQRGGQGRDRGQGGRGGYENRGPNDRDGRGNRDNRGGDRDRSDNGRGRPNLQQDSQPDGQEFEGRELDNRDNGRRFDDRDEGGDRDGGRRRREDRRPPPPQKIRDDRLYIGRGEKDGLDEAEFASLLKEHCGIEKDQLKRFLLRKNYAFADLPEGLGAEVTQKLDGVSSKAGSLYVAKATQVVTVIENQETQDSSNEGENSDSEENFDGEEQPVA